MRIAIITLPLHANYGGILQAYALQTVLKQMGHTVETIVTPWQKSMPLWRLPLAYTKRCILKFLLCRKKRIFFEQWYNRTDPPLVEHLRLFVEKELSMRLISKYSDIKDGEYDAFVVGSDQIWRPIYFDSSIENAFLSFAKDWKVVKRIAYAASFGTDKWEYTPKQTEQCRKLAMLFDAISVREESAVDICEKHLDCKVKHVLDPTMLLSVDNYCNLLKNGKPPLSDGQLLTYILDESAETECIVKKIAAKFDYKLFRINSRYEDLEAPLSERMQPSLEQWLKGFYDAKFVVTDSFHATVFSILFGKPFIVIGNRERGMSRLQSLLSMFMLEKHLLLIGEELNLNVDYNIDAQKVNVVLSKLRAKSIDFLTNHLNRI